MLRIFFFRICVRVRVCVYHIYLCFIEPDLGWSFALGFIMKSVHADCCFSVSSVLLAGKS